MGKADGGSRWGELKGTSQHDRYSCQQPNLHIALEQKQFPIAPSFPSHLLVQHRSLR